MAKTSSEGEHFGKSKAQVFRIYPFNAIREYVVGLILIFLGFRLLALLFIPVTEFEVTLVIITMLAALAVWRVPSVKPTAVDVARVFFAVILITSPFIISNLVEFYRPPEFLRAPWSTVVNLFIRLSRSPMYLTALVTFVFTIALIALVYALTMTFRFRVLLTEDSIRVERLLPMRTSFNIPISNILSVEVVQSYLGKRLNYGNVLLVTETLGTIILPKIERPVELRNLIIERYTKTTERPKPIPGAEGYTVENTI